LRWYDELVRYGQSREVPVERELPGTDAPRRTLVVVCTDRGTVIEADVDVCDLPEGELVFTNVGPTS